MKPCFKPSPCPLGAGASEKRPRSGLFSASGKKYEAIFDKLYKNFIRLGCRRSIQLLGWVMILSGK